VLLFVLLGVATAAFSQLTPPPQAAGYSLVFDDEFNTLNLSPNGLGNYNWYLFSPKSGISDSHSIVTFDLTIPNSLYARAIGSISSNAQNYHAWTYGYFEIRMKWPNTTTGAWPALWMLPVGQTTGSTAGENGGEIDIMEGQGGVSPQTIYGTVHNWVNGVDISNNEGSNTYTFPNSVNLSQYHVYGVLWTPGLVSWYVDNQFLFSATFPDPAYPAFGTEQYYLILGIQEGVNFDFGDLTGVHSRSMPMEVDWVHVWQQP
jgi:beta-glucanase (GH16 family)